MTSTMLRLTSERDIIQSLLLKSLGDDQIKFVVNDGEGNMILEFEAKHYRFTLSRVPDELYGDALRVYENSRVFLIPLFNDTDLLKKNIASFVNHLTHKLEDFYIVEIHKEKEGTVFTLTKRN